MKNKNRRQNLRGGKIGREEKEEHKAGRQDSEVVREGGEEGGK